MTPATSPPPAAGPDDGPSSPPKEPGESRSGGPLDRVELRPIGYLRTAYHSLAETPIQTSRNPDEPGRLVVLDRYVAGLEGLEEFDYAHLICLLDQVWLADDHGARPFTGDRLRPVPFLLQATGERVGVFATRSPVRPNYLALSLVRIVAVNGNLVDFRGVDLVDGTPVLDIKPFEPHLDVPGYQPGTDWLDRIRGGWYQRSNAAANPLVRPGQEGLRAAGLGSVPPADPPRDHQ